MATTNEKNTGMGSVLHHDDVPDIDQAVHIAHETKEKKISPWTRPMCRLYLVLMVAYLCGYVLASPPPSPDQCC